MFIHNEWCKKIFAYKYFDYILVTITALTVGMFRLARPSLWLDEAISIVWAAKKPLLWIWENVPKSDLHPPLYYSVLHFWQLVFGDSVFSIRSLSVLFFVGSSILIYFWVNRLFNSRRIAILTSLIFITNPFAVLYAQEVRSYSFLIFCLLLNSWFFYSILFLNNNSKKYLLGYFLTALILSYTNVLVLFGFTSHFIILLFHKDKRQFKKLFLCYVVLALAYIPVLKILSSANSFDYSYYYKENFNIFLKAVVAISGFIGARINVLNGKQHIYGLLALSLLIYFGVFLLLVWRIRLINKFILSFFVLSFGMTLIASHIKFPVPDPKYFYVAFPFFILLVGNTMAITNKKISWIIFSVVLILNLVFLYNYFFVKSYERENWKSAVGMIENDYTSHKFVRGLSITPSSLFYTPWSYYSHHLMPESSFLQYGNSTSSIQRVYSEYGGSQNDVIYLSRFLSNMYDPSDSIYNFLISQGYEKTQVFQDTKVEFWRLEKIK